MNKNTKLKLRNDAEHFLVNYFSDENNKTKLYNHFQYLIKSKNNFYLCPTIKSIVYYDKNILLSHKDLIRFHFHPSHLFTIFPNLKNHVSYDLSLIEYSLVNYFATNKQRVTFVKEVIKYKGILNFYVIPKFKKQTNK